MNSYPPHSPNGSQRRRHRPLFGLLAVLFCLLSAGHALFRGANYPLHAATIAAPVRTDALAVAWHAEQGDDDHEPASLLPWSTATTTADAKVQQAALPLTWGTIPTPTLYLPYVAQRNKVQSLFTLPERIGFGLTSSALSAYTDVTTLGAGWYLDWRVREKPERPAGIAYVQMVRVHQKLACGEWYHSDRALCPYAKPLDYQYRPSRATIEAAAKANPGALWLIGNEMDRIDWAYCVTWNGSHCDVVGYNGQDEILPQTYAVAYHDLYAMIKA
ncbi:MAG: hypothetical protein KDE31_36950, partial [Caldilineaceae bacterium]|nr:hypothetical protein [Caldilineaceae bacterium]